MVLSLLIQTERVAYERAGDDLFRRLAPSEAALLFLSKTQFG